MISLYNVVSKDGFIADKEGGEDFIPDELWNEFLNLCSHYDALVIGRKTYEAIQSYDDDSVIKFENLPIKKIVISRDEKFTPKSNYLKLGKPEDVLGCGENILLCSGPTLNTSFYQAGLLDQVILNELYVAVGEGLLPFSVPVNLNLKSEEQRPHSIFRIYTVKNDSSR